MNVHDESAVVVERVGGGSVLLVTMNRPDVCNAMDQAMYKRLIGVLSDAASDDTVRCVVMTGSGRYFSSGRDLNDAIAVRVDAPEQFERTLYRAEGVAHFYGYIARYSKPIIAAVNGPAVGGGACTAVLSDVAVMAASAYLAFPELQRGTIPIGASLALPRLIGRQRAMLLLLTGGRLSSAEAERLGLIALIEEDSRVLATALTIAEQVARSSPVATRFFKTALHAGPWGIDPAEDIAREALESIVESGPEYKEAWEGAARSRQKGYSDAPGPTRSSK